MGIARGAEEASMGDKPLLCLGSSFHQCGVPEQLEDSSNAKRKEYGAPSPRYDSLTWVAAMQVDKSGLFGCRVFVF